MKSTRMILSILALVGLIAFSAACTTSYRVMHIEDHPAGNTTLMETQTTRHMLAGLYNKSEYNFWECHRTQDGLDCNKVCYNPDQFGNFPDSVEDQDLACQKYGVRTK